VKFLDDQIKRYEEILVSAENRLKDFKLKYLGVADREGPDYFGRIAKLQSSIADARMEMQSAEQARDSYRKELAGETPLFIDSNENRQAESVPEIDARIATLRKDLDDLRRKYTDQHPDVQGTKRLIEQLEEQKTTELEARRKAAAGGKRNSAPGVDRNPVFQQLRISLAEAEANLASARSKLAGYEAQYKQLKAQAQLVPQVEAEFAQLNRDYDVQKKTYESLLARRESAAMGKDVQDSGGARFKVIDPPRVSPEPVPPRRIWLLLGAFVASLGVGIFASFIASQVMPIFHDARTLREVAKRPIIGMVSLLPSDRWVRSRRRSAYLFAGGLGGLLATFAAIFAIATLIGRAA